MVAHHDAGQSCQNLAPSLAPSGFLNSPPEALNVKKALYYQWSG